MIFIKHKLGSITVNAHNPKCTQTTNYVTNQNKAEYYSLFELLITSHHFHFLQSRAITIKHLQINPPIGKKHEENKRMIQGIT